MALTKVTGDFIKAGSITQGHLHSSHGITTTHIAEGDKLFFTNARVDSRVGSLSTSNLSEGTNLYYTDARVDARIAAASTSDLSEGTNLYYTDARADARVALIVDSAPGTLNTLNELAAALGDDANFSTTVTNSIATKLPLAGGTLTGALNGTTATFSGIGQFAGAIRITENGTAQHILIGNQDSGGVNKPGMIRSANASLEFGYGNSWSGEGGTMTTTLTLHSNSNATFAGSVTASSGTGHFSVVNASGYQLNGTYVMDSSRNLVNIAAITASGNVTGANLNISNWDTAYGWGNHASAGYLTSSTGFPKGADIGTSADLNNYTSNGYYHQNSNALAAGGSNYPSAVAGMLTVKADGVMVYQTYQGYGANSTWERKYYNGSWQSWHKQWDSGEFANNSGNWDTAYGWGNHASAGYTTDLGFSRYNAATTYAFGNLQRFTSNTNLATASGTQSSLEVFSNGSGNDAFMTFHVGSDYAIYLGLDGGTNKLSVGGWSMGANSYEIYHSGNKPSLATLGYTGATNANYITNNNQLTNGAGYTNNLNDRFYLTDTRSASRAPSYYDDRYIQGDFSQSSNFGVSGGDSWAGILTVSKWSSWDAGHRQEQLIFAGTKISRRVATSDTAWSSTYDIIDTSSVDNAKAGYIQSNSSLRAPIFYDSNNTARYIDPASTSRINRLEIENTSNQDTPTAYMQIGSDGFIFGGNNSGYENNSAQISAGYHVSNSLNFVGMGTTSTVRRMDFWAEGGFYVSGIIYDKDSTSYYLDLGNTSITNSIISNVFSGNISTSGDGQNNYPFRLRHDYNAWMMAAASNTWGLFWAGNSGARYGTNGNGGPGNIWSNSTNPNEFAFVGSDSTAWTVHGSSGNVWLKGYGTAAGSYRAPIFYDSDNTFYYLDPGSITRLSGLKLEPGSANQASGADNVLWIHRVNNNDWGIQIDADQSDATDYGYEFSGGSSHTYAFSGVAAGTRYFNVGSSYAQHNGDFRAPIFYDSNNTAYYTDPSGYSNVWGVAVRGDLSNTGTGNQIFFWGSGNSTTSAIGFKANGGNFANPTGNGDGYNTYLTMDTAGRGWVFRQGTGGSNFTSLNNSGWILNNGIWQANASMRSPIFYDSNNTGYYVDPNSTSRLLNLDFGVAGYYLKAGDWGVRQQTPYGWIQFGPANTSHAHIYTDLSNFYFNKQIQLSGGSLINQNDIRAGVFYDVNNTGYYVDPASTSFISNLTMNGNIEIRRADPTIYLRDTNHNSAMLHANSNVFYVLRGGNDTTTWTTVNGYWPLEINLTNNQATFGGVLIAITDMRAPHFYDSQNTTYYTNPASTSNMNAVTLVGTFSGQNGYFNQDLAVGFNSGAIGGKVNIQINSINGIGVKNNLNGKSGVTGLLQYTSASYASSGYNMVFQAAPPSGTDQNMLLCYINGNIVNRFNSYGQYSDIKLKENIVDTTPKLEDVKRIRIRNFNFKGDPYKQIGVVAQEFEEVFPGLVEDKEVPDEEGTTKTVKYSVLVPILVKAMQEQQVIIDDLKSRLETLENQ